MLEKLFKLKAHNTTVRTGITIFLAMAYILFVNPSILGATGMDKGAVFVVTCLAAAIGCVLMGLIANYPIAPTFMQLDIAGAFNVGLVRVIFAFLFVDVFDNTGTLLGVTKRACRQCAENGSCANC